LNTPRNGLVVCNSGASNTGHLTGLAALQVIKRLGPEKAGICSLPALANRLPRQTAVVKKIQHLTVIDGCRNECSAKILKAIGIAYENYLNLEHDLGIEKQGPFSTINYSEGDVEKVASAIIEKLRE